MYEVDCTPPKRTAWQKLRTATFLLVAFPIACIAGAPIAFVNELREIEAESCPRSRKLRRKLSAASLLISIPAMGIIGAPLVFVSELLED